MMRNALSLWLVAIVVLITLLACSHAQGQPVLHVDARAMPGGDGASWETAYRDMQDALDQARSDPSVQEIWVAGGTYYPDRGTGDRNATFALVSNVGVFGGFAGNELTRPPRWQRVDLTLLSGDIGVHEDPVDNSKAVVTVFSNVVDSEIENVTVAHGNGTWGSGLNANYLALAIRIIGCTFRDNRSTWGGGILIDEPEQCKITDCVFDSNTANHGAGLYLNNIDTTTEIVDCRFYDNHAFGFGGAVANSSSHPVFRNCTFVNNRADREGGALSNSGGDALFINCILWENMPTPIRDQESITTITYSCITGGWPGEGNFSADPLLIDFGNGNLHLAPNSPCIDAGNNDGVPPEQMLDLDFNPRFADDFGTPDTGRGTAPVVDLGCYEFQGTSFAMLEPVPGQAGRVNRLTAIGAQPGATIWFVYGLHSGSTAIPGCPGVTIGIEPPKVAGNATANNDGIATLDRFVPRSAQGRSVFLGAVDHERCLTTRVLTITFE